MKTEAWLDKSDWGDGAWQTEPDRAEWRDEGTGLDCLALRQPTSGHWCGYVAVPPDHPWHGKDWMEIDADVHYGLTFGSLCANDSRPARERVCHVPRPGESDNVWWIGFDCRHLHDYAPASVARERARGWEPDPEEVYRSLSYVEAEIRSLASQVAAAGSVRDTDKAEQ